MPLGQLGVGGERQKGGGRDGDGRVELDVAMAAAMLEDMTYLWTRATA